jgi:predicted nucleic acid-binding protein
VKRLLEPELQILVQVCPALRRPAASSAALAQHLGEQIAERSRVIGATAGEIKPLETAAPVRGRSRSRVPGLVT